MLLKDKYMHALATVTTSFFLATGTATAGQTFGALAVGVPYEDISTIERAGAVNIIYATPDGLRSSGNQAWHQDVDDIEGRAESHDYFGESLATGDFNNDGFPDLAVGVPYEDIETIYDAGAVNVIYGSAEGLIGYGNQIWHQDSDNIIGRAESSDYYGSALATGDFNNDGFSDLAIGVPGEDIETTTRAGIVNVMYGSKDGLTSVGNQSWHQDSEGILYGAEPYDLFGSSLASGDFNNDGFSDLAIGAPNEDVDIINSAGSVSIIYGSSDGLNSTGNQVWNQDSAGINGTAEAYDQFGDSLATGDFNNDGFSDLAVGVPSEDVGIIDEAGAVNIIYGSSGGLNSTGNQVWNQDSAGINGMAYDDGSFGESLATGDFNSDGFQDLAVSAPGKPGTLTTPGAVHIIFGTSSGLSSSGNQVWQELKEFDGSAVKQGNDGFGYSLTTGDFNNDGFVDLAAGMPWGDLYYAERSDIGFVYINYGSVGGLANTSSQVWYQGSSGIVSNAEADDKFGHSLLYIPPGRYVFPWPMFLPALTIEQ